MGLFSSKKENNMVAPPAPLVTIGQGNTDPSMLPEIKKLSTPPMPGGSLDDIKREVSSSKSIQNNVIEEPEVKEEQYNVNNSQDSLFDLSELDIPEAQNLESEEEVYVESEEEIEADNDKEGLDFINKHHSKVKSNETYFITTKQFKTLLEIVEGVKNKVKDASETHLKLLDIKAEEDIEYENMKKDFEYIEDKLHEVDSIIFDN